MRAVIPVSFKGYPDNNIRFTTAACPAIRGMQGVGKPATFAKRRFGVCFNEIFAFTTTHIYCRHSTGQTPYCCRHHRACNAQRTFC